MVLDIIYNLFITPIEMLIEFIFSIIYHICANPGISIICVSIAVNFLVLPLYKRSDALQDEERQKQAQMKPWLDHIKKNFKGDERYMMTQTYYRQQGYKPIYALKSSFSLLLQIPFFIAAYHYLSNLQILQNASFLCFSNLGEPDQLIPFFFGLHLNLLPILMTAINVVSGAIYTKGFPLKEKLQLYVIALVFLVLLYNSPSGLVFYWTLNNIFSLGKNVVMKLIPKREKRLKKQPEKFDKSIYITGIIFISVFIGLIIPLSAITTSPSEFITDNYGPTYLAIHTFSIIAGLFIVWLSVFYYLASNRGKNIITFGVWIIAGIALVNFYLFGNDLGTTNAQLIYDEEFNITLREWGLSALASIAAAGVFYALIRFFKRGMKVVGTILVMTVIGLSVFNIVGMQDAVNEAYEIKEKSKIDEDEKILSLSKNGQNVIVFMLDRAISAYVPEEVEILGEDAFDGFTYYPNTLAFARFTNFSTPSLFGGYEYMPTEINARSDESLCVKQTEALSVLPVIYNNEDWDVTVCDPPYYGNYSLDPDLSGYSEYENISAYNTIGAYDFEDSYEDIYESKQKWNVLGWSIFRSIPSMFKNTLYDEGMYFSTTAGSNVHSAFIKSYVVLQNLVNMTEITDDGNDFLMMQNSTTHEPVDLDENYELDVNGAKIDATQHEKYIDVNVASFKELSIWFDYLKEEGAWDNTRIIICSDHGALLGEYNYLVDEEKELDVQAYNALLLVKDFNQTGFNTDNTFMTLGDIATLATEGVVASATNPFTGKAITNDAKYSGKLYVVESDNWDTSTNNGNVFDLGKGFFWKFTGNNVFDLSKWERVE